MLRLKKTNLTGFSIVEVIFLIAIITLVFAGLFTGFEYSLKLIAHTRAKMSALSLVTDRSEYIRSLPYSSIGTVSGLPNGLIPQTRIVSLNGIEFTERVLIEYVDDPADGVGSLDSNSVIADYKRFKIEYSWTINDVTDSFSLISTVTPRSIETDAGGGTLRVNVFDSLVEPLPGISVRLLNKISTSTIDVTRTTDATGVALFTGAPAGAGYEVFVFASGYSSEQTRQATTSLPFPAVQPFAVLEADVSTVNFQVDRLSDLNITAFNAETKVDVVESFTNLLNMFATTSVTTTSGALTLKETVGVYETVGSVIFNPITPAVNESWGLLSITKNVPSGTDARVRIYASTTLTSLIDDVDLPGNTAGFPGTKINLSVLNPLEYPTIVVGIDLSTNNNAITPVVDEVLVSYSSERTKLANTAMTIFGSKVIGMDASSQNSYKFNIATSTNGSGQIKLENIEWDTYKIILGDGYDVSEACTTIPYYLAPDTQKILNIYAEIGGTHNLRVLAKDSSGNPIAGASVRLDNLSGTVLTNETGVCGQAFFANLNNTSEYELQVGALGFATTTQASTTISGTTYQEVIINP